MRPRISIRGRVRPSIGQFVHRPIYRYIGPLRQDDMQSGYARASMDAEWQCLVLIKIAQRSAQDVFTTDHALDLLFQIFTRYEVY